MTGSGLLSAAAAGAAGAVSGSVAGAVAVAVGSGVVADMVGVPTQLAVWFWQKKRGGRLTAVERTHGI